MEPATVPALGSAALALWAAGFHGWIYRLRRGEPEHLWLAVTAVGVVGVSGFHVLLYASGDVVRGEACQRWMFSFAALVLVGFLRFSFHFLDVHRPRLDRAGRLFACGVVGLALGTGGIFNGEPVVRHVAGASFVESGLDVLGYAAVTGFLFFFACAVWLHARQRRGGDADGGLVLGSLCVWFGTGLNDGAVAVGLWEGPYLLVLGFVALLAAMSAILLRRFACSLESLEELAGSLHELAERRTAELRRTELQLAHGEKLATLGTLAASVAHEINNPIAFVRSNLNRLGELWDKPDAADDVEDILSESRDGIERVRVIVSQLLDVARRGDGHAEPVDANQVVRSVLPFVRTLAPHARVETDLRPLPRVTGDPRLLGQVVLNLVMNAVQASEAGDPAAARPVVVESRSGGGSVRLAVRDRGPGIPPALRDRIFEPFFTTKAGGTGLGLAVSRQIVARHGGDIRVEEGGRGTTLVVELPGARGSPPHA